MPSALEPNCAHLIAGFDAGYREGIEVAPYFAKRTQMWLGRVSRPLPMSTDQSVKAHLPARRALSEQSTISRSYLIAVVVFGRD